MLPNLNFSLHIFSRKFQAHSAQIKSKVQLPKISHFLTGGRFDISIGSSVATDIENLVREMLRSLLRHRHAIRAVGSGAAPSDLIRARILERQRLRRRPRDPAGDEIFVPTPESAAWLDTASMPMVLTAVAIALFAKLLMMYDESTAQERLERKIQKAPEGQGTVRMLTREEWEEIQEIRPRTPFESKLARSNARIRTGDPVRLEDVRDWTIDVITDALTRVEDSVKHK